MIDARNRYRAMVATVPEGIREEINLSFAVSNRIETLMKERGLSRKQFADALGKRPCEVTKCLSGEHNFTLATLGMLSAFFGCPIVRVGGWGEEPKIVKSVAGAVFCAYLCGGGGMPLP